MQAEIEKQKTIAHEWRMKYLMAIHAPSTRDDTASVVRCIFNSLECISHHHCIHLLKDWAGRSRHVLCACCCEILGLFLEGNSHFNAQIKFFFDLVCSSILSFGLSSCMLAAKRHDVVTTRGGEEKVAKDGLFTNSHGVSTW